MHDRRFAIELTAKRVRGGNAADSLGEMPADEAEIRGALGVSVMPGALQAIQSR
jgi:hypothetical protein